MGGRGSGRTKTHACIEADCLTIDTAWLRKKKMLTTTNGATGVLHWRTWTETNFSKRQEKDYYAQVVYIPDEQQAMLLLAYHATVKHEQDYCHEPTQEKTFTETLLMDTTPCHYGGVRYWFLAPCCGRRVRVLYLNIKCGDLKQMRPQCRTCLDAHYASQLQSYRDRYITYEKYLLSNYGYGWAQIEYDCMKEHYLKMTPYWEYVKQRSVLNRQVEFMKLLIRHENFMQRTHARQLASLKSEEDRRVYTQFLVREHGQQYALDLVQLLFSSIEMERMAQGLSSSSYLDLVYSVQEDDDDNNEPQSKKKSSIKTPLDLATLRACKADLEEEQHELDARWKRAA